MEKVDVLYIEQSKVTYLRDHFNQFVDFQLDPVSLLNVCQLKNLTSLGFYDSGLTHIPQELGSLVHLRLVNLSCNKIDRLPSSFSQLRLNELYLGRNRFTRFPLVLCEMTSLFRLNLSNNFLERVPNTKLELRLLLLDNNKITHMPKWIIHCDISSFLGNPCFLGRWHSRWNTFCDRTINKNRLDFNPDPGPLEWKDLDAHILLTLK